MGVDCSIQIEVPLILFIDDGSAVDVLCPLQSKVQLRSLASMFISNAGKSQDP